MPGKTITWRKIISRKWDLSCVEVRSHLGEINPYSYKQFGFTKWNTPFYRYLTQMRQLTWVGWFFSYKQLLKKVVKYRYWFDSISLNYIFNALTKLCSNFPNFSKGMSVKRVSTSWLLIKNSDKISCSPLSSAKTNESLSLIVTIQRFQNK